MTLVPEFVRQVRIPTMLLQNCEAISWKMFCSLVIERSRGDGFLCRLCGFAVSRAGKPLASVKPATFSGYAARGEASVLEELNGTGGDKAANQVITNIFISAS